MMQTIHPKVLTDEQFARLGSQENIDAMIDFGSPYAKAIAMAFESLEGDCISQRKMLRDLFDLFDRGY